MKQYWDRFASKVDGLTLRERAIVFAMAALVLITLMNALMLDPLFARNKLLSGQIKDEQTKLAALQEQIQATVRLQTADPDAAAHQRLIRLTEQVRQKRTSLQEIQKGLVSPDKMSDLLEGILKRNGKLRLVSLRTLPAVSLGAAQETVSKRPTQAAGVTKSKTEESAPTEGVVYKHGVEIAVQGGYLDMLDYLNELESMPSQVFWGKASLSADEYPRATLTLTLYTLSLDKQWLNI